MGIIADAEKIMISVQDSGIGIQEMDSSKLFRFFGKIDESGGNNISNNETGVGMGLAISQNIIRLLNEDRGQITFRSVYGEGSVFSFPIFYRLLPEFNEYYCIYIYFFLRNN